ncbi:MAG: hypothetical protein QXM96_03895 [Candidatus Woesearchaeota archaeon]
MIKKILEIIKNFFRIFKEYIVYILTSIVVIFLFIYRKNLKVFVIDFFQDKTNSLREQKEKNDQEKNKSYKATQINEYDKTIKPNRNESTKKTKDSLIERNKKHIERLKNEK